MSARVLLLTATSFRPNKNGVKEMKRGKDNNAIIARQFETLAAKIAKLTSDRPVLVGIDGITASGKTTLADRLAVVIRELGRPVVRATIDGFHNPADIRYTRGKESAEGYYRDSFNYDALTNVLLKPLSRMSTDGGVLPIASYDFRQDGDVTDEHAQFTQDTILLFDGVMLFREEINQFWNYRVYVDARFQTCFVRGVPRDAASEEDQMIVGQKYLNRYFPGQRLYLASAKPLEQADAIVFNDDSEACVIRYNSNSARSR